MTEMIFFVFRVFVCIRHRYSLSVIIIILISEISVLYIMVKVCNGDFIEDGPKVVSYVSSRQCCVCCQIIYGVAHRI